MDDGSKFFSEEDERVKDYFKRVDDRHAEGRLWFEPSEEQKKRLEEELRKDKHAGTSIGHEPSEAQEAVVRELNAMAELGTEGMTPEQILGAPTVIYPGPRPKKGQPGYRAGMTKKHNRGLPKNKRKMAEKSRKMNRGK